MHIGINAQLLSYGHNYRNGGVSRYIRCLLTELARDPGNHKYTVFVNGQDVIDQLPSHTQISYFSAPWPEAQPTRRVAWEQLTLPALVRQKHIDVLHSPVNVRPELLPASCATIITLHDLAFLRFPHVLTRAKRLYHRTFTVHSLRHATLLITVSESTRRDAHELVGIPLDRIHTIHPCIDERFSKSISTTDLHNFRAQHDLMSGFILYLGTLEPRKNITTLLDAYAELRRTHSIQEKLVLAGSKGWLYDAIFAKVQQLGLTSEVIFPGFVDDAEQSLWYHAASVFAYPALYEGFGIPVAEALVSGTPVVTSNVSSLPEAGADLALCVDPTDVHSLSEALYTALTDQTLRARCRSQASSVAARFSAQLMATKTLAAYEQAALLQQKHIGTAIV